jgi:hypothetical protein
MKRILLLSTCILSILLFFYYFSGRADKVTHGFASYYTFSRLLLEEENFSRAYDTSFFNLKIREFGIENIRDAPNNIPTSAFLYVPVALFRPETGKIIWTILSIIFYLLSIYLLLRVFDLDFTAIYSLFLILIALQFYPVFGIIDLGQIYIFLLLLFSLSLYGFKNKNIILTALPISLMLIFKGYGLVPFIFLLFFKKWKEALLSLAILAGLIVVTLPVLSLESWKQYIINVSPKIGHDQYASYTAYQTLNSFMRHIFPGQSELIYILVLLILLVLVLIIFVRNFPQNEGGRLLFYCSALSLNVIFAPLAEEYHYILFLPLIFGSGKMIFMNYKNLIPKAIIFIISLYLIYVPFDYKSLNDAPLPRIITAYPKLYAGILLLLLPILLAAYAIQQKEEKIELPATSKEV